MAGLVEFVDDWVRYRRTHSRRGLSPNSEIAYRQDLAALARRIATLRGFPAPDPLTSSERLVPHATTNLQLGRVLPQDLTSDAVEEVASELVREGKSAATRARMLSAWRGFSRWLVLQGHLVADPTLAFETPMADARLPVAFSDEELRAILKAAKVEPDAQRRAQWRHREVALIGVLAGAGLRAGELVGLKVGDIGRQVNEKGGSLFRLSVTGKGSKDRVVPVAGEVIDAVDAYLRDRCGPASGRRSSSSLLLECASG